jgi:hypothetical protein
VRQVKRQVRQKEVDKDVVASKVMTNIKINDLQTENQELKNRIEQLELMVKELDKGALPLDVPEISNESKALALENEELKSKNLKILQQLGDSKKIASGLMKKVDSFKSNPSQLNLHTLMDELNLSSNARKFYKAILDLSSNEWTAISSRVLKFNYKVHSAFFSSSRLELKDHGLIDFKEDYQDGTRRRITSYKNLKS